MSSTIWPSHSFDLTAEQREELALKLHPGFVDLLNQMQLPAALQENLKTLYLPLSVWLASHHSQGQTLKIGVNGGQGTGKSTLCALLKFILEQGFALKTCVLSIDDLYLTRSERLQLSSEVHPLLETRGVPGTHDVNLGLALFEKLSTAGASDRVAIPRFDKSVDDRFPESSWDRADGPVEVILFEGWCVGAQPEKEAELAAPLNSLERNEDQACDWRSYVNLQLQGRYRDLFSRLDLLLMLKVPSWEQIYTWRKKQEQALAKNHPEGTKIMDESALKRFIMHYERLTRHQLREMPERADLVMELDKEQQVRKIRIK